MFASFNKLGLHIIGQEGRNVKTAVNHGQIEIRIAKDRRCFFLGRKRPHLLREFAELYSASFGSSHIITIAELGGKINGKIIPEGNNS
jgi:hypothetical protein